MPSVSLYCALNLPESNIFWIKPVSPSRAHCIISPSRGVFGEFAGPFCTLLSSTSSRVASEEFAAAFPVELTVDGVDRFAKTFEIKTPATVADEMRSTTMWHRALSECGYDEDGNPQTLPLGLTSLVKDRRVMAKFFFFWPVLSLWAAISILSGMPIYAGLPISVVVSFVLQKFVVYLAQRGPSDYHHIHRTPFLAGVFAGTLFWVGIRWVFSILPITFTSHPVFNIVFAAFYGLTTYFFFTSLLEDPGYVPRMPSRNSQKKVIEELFSLWKFDEDNFCVHCMIRKPLRSKHCRRCGRCVAKHDQ